MYVKYKGIIGELHHYQLLDNENVSVALLLDDGAEVRAVCKESEISIPNIKENGRILDDILEQIDFE